VVVRSMKSTSYHRFPRFTLQLILIHCQPLEKFDVSRMNFSSGDFTCFDV